MKINFDDYKTAISYALVSEEHFSNIHIANRTIEFIANYLDTHLVCGHCRVVLPDEQFYKSRSHRNRRGRNSTCKACFSKVYQQ